MRQSQRRLVLARKDRSPPVPPRHAGHRFTPGDRVRSEFAPLAGTTKKGADGGPAPAMTIDDQWFSACTISSVTFLASPNSIIVFGRKNNSLSTPAYPDAIDRFTNSTVLAFSTSRIGIP